MPEEISHGADPAGNPARPAAVRYPTLYRQMESLLEGETDWVANLSNAAALLYSVLPAINWVGFYRLRGGELLVGPFQGLPACVHIPVGRGVCGTAVARDATQCVSDVRRFPGHIACDARSAAELVIPLHDRGRIVGVLDIDSPVPGRFDAAEAAELERIAARIGSGCRWPD